MSKRHNRVNRAYHEIGADGQERISDLRLSLPRIIERKFTYQTEPTFINQTTGRVASSVHDILRALNWGNVAQYGLLSEGLLCAAKEHGFRRYDLPCRRPRPGGTVCLDLEFIEQIVCEAYPIKGPRKFAEFRQRENVK